MYKHTAVTVSETLNKKIEYGVALEQDPLWKSILRFLGSALSYRSGWEGLGAVHDPGSDVDPKFCFYIGLKRVFLKL